MPDEPAETWIFGYGSLMWSPGFAYREARPARLAGFHRAFCVYSIHYRGTERRPGLVLGLDRGGVCDGIAFRVAPEDRAATLGYLRRRELIYGVYREALVSVDLAHDADSEPKAVWAVAYIAERCHPAYAGALPLHREAHLIRRSTGFGGTNLDYLISTRRHLQELGIREPRLDRLAAVIGAGRIERTHGPGGSPISLARARVWALKPARRPRTVRDNRFGFRAKLAGL